MRISDWSSDVCSSDLHTLLPLDSDYQWADFLARTGRAGDPDEARRRNDDLMVRYHQGQLTADQAAESMLGLLAAHQPFAPAAWPDEFMAQVVRPAIHPQAPLPVEQHPEDGRTSGRESRCT